MTRNASTPDYFGSLKTPTAPAMQTGFSHPSSIMNGGESSHSTTDPDHPWAQLFGVAGGTGTGTGVDGGGGEGAGAGTGAGSSTGMGTGMSGGSGMETPMAIPPTPAASSSTSSFHQPPLRADPTTRSHANPTSTSILPSTALSDSPAQSFSNATNASSSSSSTSTSLSTSLSTSSNLSLKMPASMARVRSGGSATSASPQGSLGPVTAAELEKYKPIEPISLAQLLSSHHLPPGVGKGEKEKGRNATTSMGSSSQSSTTFFSPFSTATLIIDIRPSTSFGLARIRGSINLCAPSTLLKRSGVTVERIEEEMLSSEEDQAKFSTWRKGPQKQERQGDKDEDGNKSVDGDEKGQDNAAAVTRIVVLDTDTRRVEEGGKPAAGGGGPCLTGLLRKFDLAGFAGELCWLVGGFNLFASKIGAAEKSGEEEAKYSNLVDRSSLQRCNDNKKETESKKGALSQLRRESSQRRASMPLSRTASSQMDGGRKAGEESNRKFSLVHPRGLPMEAFMSCSTVTGQDKADERSQSVDTSHIQTSAVEPTMDALSQQQNEPGESLSMSTGAACANPFFDNIRQNRELQHGVTERVPLRLPDLNSSQVEALPAFLKSLVTSSEGERAEVLAQAFFDIEKAEQQRLIATMQQHAAESKLANHGKKDTIKDGTLPPSSNAPSTKSRPKLQRSPSSIALRLSSPYCAVGSGKRCDNVPSRETFPFSIAAALERGAENRYNNIWTYEHSRVRLANELSQSPSKDDNPSDYLNGSYLEPAREFGCRRRYIATQAPLPSTFDTFWTVVWQQNVRTIVMITRDHESGRLQSHNYWSQTQFGSKLRLDAMDEVTLDAHGQPIKADISLDDGGGNLFPSLGGGLSSDGRRKPAMIKRTFHLLHADDASRKPRKITHLQFIDWPDYSIPDSADSLLNYMQLASRAQQEAEMEHGEESDATGPKKAHVGPLVVHCSAGVGRTGTYVVIDSVLDVLRRNRRAIRGESDLGIWDDGHVGSRSGESLQDATVRGREGNMDWRRSSNASSSTTSSSTDFFGRFSNPTPSSNFSRTPRRSLKRELSPSAMDVDSSDADDPSERDIRSPPPWQRCRSDDAEDVSGNSNSSTNGTSPTKILNSSSEIPSLRGNKATAAFLATGSSSSPSVESVLGSRRPSTGTSSGVETPSRAMGSMRIAWDASTTPLKNSNNEPFSSSSSSSSSTSAEQTLDRQASSVSSYFGHVTSSTAIDNGKDEERFHSFGSATCLPQDVDLIRKAVETIREQRMSTVQTTRQFVFAYSAVLEGLLRDWKNEESLAT